MNVELRYSAVRLRAVVRVEADFPLEQPMSQVTYQQTEALFERKVAAFAADLTRNFGPRFRVVVGR